jgi:beta-aspartyl-peptidase (threonine type)
MKYFSLIAVFVGLILATGCKQSGISKTTTDKTEKQEWALVVHGGAGNLAEEVLSDSLNAQYKSGLNEALQAGKLVLQNGGAALDAVETVIRKLEDNPLFNAGKGAAFANSGKNEMDASIMDGSNLAAGAVASVTDIKNPITAARAVMEHSVHVMLSGAGASEFAKEQGLEIVDPSYFFTQRKWDQLQDLKKAAEHGTVGCVALDKKGNLAAGTSTGGMANKKYNRIGDSPIIGAGTYANNATCAISCTGHGEYFIRYTVAHDVSALMEYKGISLQDAANLVIKDKLVKAGGEGGLIGVDKSGNITMTYNTSGMFRAFATADGKEGVLIFDK